MDERKYRIQMTAITLLDIVAILVSFLAANFIRNRSIWLSGIEIENSTIILYIILVYLLISFFRNSKKKFHQRGSWAEMVDIVKGVTGFIAVLIISVFCVKRSSQFSRMVVLYFYILSILLMWVFRCLYKWYMTQVLKRSFYTKRLVIVTMSDQVEEILEKIHSECIWNYKLKGLILLDAKDEVIETDYHGVQIMGNYHNMFDCVTQRVVDEIFIHIPYSSGLHVMKAIERYEDMGIAVSLNVQVYDLKLRHRSKELREFGDYYAITFKQSVIDFKMRAVKRTMDICGALVGLAITGIITIFLAPVLLIESPGPLVFSQTRVGLNGRRFKIYKFRSMYKDAEERKKELMEKNEMNGLMFKMENDPRITKVGKFIRKTSIDELPQFWNVLKGDMSLIGTRPPTLDEFEKYKTEYKRRLSIRPGITGMWQATGRSDISDFEEVLALDLEYIDNWSISLDIKLLFLTVFGVFIGKGAR